MTIQYKIVEDCQSFHMTREFTVLFIIITLS